MPSVPIPPRPELVVCDLAGSTIYDRGEVPAAFEQALREAGLAFDAAEVAGWRGASKREVVGAHGRATLAAAPHTHLCEAVTALPALWDQVVV